MSLRLRRSLLCCSAAIVPRRWRLTEYDEVLRFAESVPTNGFFSYRGPVIVVDAVADGKFVVGEAVVSPYVVFMPAGHQCPLGLTRPTRAPCLGSPVSTGTGSPVSSVRGFAISLSKGSPRAANLIAAAKVSSSSNMEVAISGVTSSSVISELRNAALSSGFSSRHR